VIAARSEAAILADLGGAADAQPEPAGRGRRARGEDPPSLF
jgi:hypothetical protein